MNRVSLTLPRFFTLLIALFVSAAGLSASGGKWMTNYQEALAIAKSENKITLLQFHGSDWCPPCMKLKSEVFEQAGFKDFAQKNLVLVDADFPRRTALPADLRAHNEALAKEFGVRGFPTVFLIAPDGKVLDSVVGFPRGGLQGFMDFVKKAVAQVE